MSKSQVTTLDDGPAPAAQPAQALKIPAGAAGFSGKKVLLTIAKGQDKDTGAFAAFVGVNGVGFQIPRGKPYEAPAEIVGVLNDAVETHYSRDEVTGDSKVDEVPRYMFTAVPIGA